MGAGAYFGTTLFFTDVSLWLANYITVEQTLNIATYATTILSGAIVGYIAYRIVGGIIGSIFLRSIHNAMHSQIRNNIPSRRYKLDRHNKVNPHNFFR